MIKSRNEVSMSGGTRTPRDPGGGDHILMNEANGKPTPIAIVLGMDPRICRSPPARPCLWTRQRLRRVRGRRRAGAASPTQLVKCETNDLLVPWLKAEIILEGRGDPERAHRGGSARQSRPASTAKTSGRFPDQDQLRHAPAQPGELRPDLPADRRLPRACRASASGSFQNLLIEKTGMTNIKHAYFPEVGRFGMLIVSAQIRDAGDPRRIMDAVWEHGDWRWVIVVDEDCDVRDWNDVMWRRRHADGRPAGAPRRARRRTDARTKPQAHGRGRFRGAVAWDGHRRDHALASRAMKYPRVNLAS